MLAVFKIYFFKLINLLDISAGLKYKNVFLNKEFVFIGIYVVKNLIRHQKMSINELCSFVKKFLIVQKI